MGYFNILDIKMLDESYDTHEKTELSQYFLIISNISYMDFLKILTVLFSLNSIKL